MSFGLNGRAGGDSQFISCPSDFLMPGSHAGMGSSAHDSPRICDDGTEEDEVSKRFIELGGSDDDDGSSSESAFDMIFDSSGEIPDANWLGPLGSGGFSTSEGYGEFPADSDDSDDSDDHGFGGVGLKTEISQYETENSQSAMAVAPFRPRRARATRAKASPGKLVLFKCSVKGCDYSTIHSRYLTDHEARHAGHRPYPCPHPGCSYRALSSGHITRHMVTHTKVKPFGCTWTGCKQRFSQMTHLKAHLLQHKGWVASERASERSLWPLIPPDKIPTVHV
jgi:hypothetical protein